MLTDRISDALGYSDVSIGKKVHENEWDFNERDDQNEKSLLSELLFTRIAYLSLGIIETIGALISLFSFVPYTCLALIGEALYLPARVYYVISFCANKTWEGVKFCTRITRDVVYACANKVYETWKYSTDSVRGCYSKKLFLDLGCQTGRLAVGALSSFTLGVVIYPYWNSCVHRNWIVPKHVPDWNQPYSVKA